MASLARETDALLSIQEGILSCKDFSTLERDVLAPAAAFLDALTSCFMQFWVSPAGEIREESLGKYFDRALLRRSR